jgi:hypothetical protein
MTAPREHNVTLVNVSFLKDTSNTHACAPIVFSSRTNYAAAFDLVEMLQWP